MKLTPIPENDNDLERIAIIGMAIRAPGARNIDEFWSNLRGGIESIEKYTENLT